MEAIFYYLGDEINGEGIKPGKRKIQAVIEFPVPTGVHVVIQFIGLASYFRKFKSNGEIGVNIVFLKEEEWFLTVQLHNHKAQ